MSEDGNRKAYIVALLYQFADELVRKHQYDPITLEDMVEFFNTQYSRVAGHKFPETKRPSSIRGLIKSEAATVPFKLLPSGKYCVSYPWKDGRV